MNPDYWLCVNAREKKHHLTFVEGVPPDDTTIVATFAKLLKPFVQSTARLSGSAYPSASCITFTKDSILSVLDHFSKSSEVQILDVRLGL